MDKGDEEWASVLIYSVLAAIIVSAMLTFAATGYSLNNSWQERAVKAGVAEYVADKNGKPQWQWKKGE